MIEAPRDTWQPPDEASEPGAKASSGQMNEASSTRRNIVVIGASHGGVEALQTLVKNLAPDLSAAVFIVVHVASDGPALLAEILCRAGRLPVSYGRDGETFELGHVYLAPPDHHLLIKAPNRIRLSRGPKENRARPAVDPLFRSATLAFGPRVIGIVLTGHLDDGTVGLAAIKRRGGIAIVQDPNEAWAPSMPSSALRYVKADHCVGLAEMAALINQLVNSSDRQDLQSSEVVAMTDELQFEVDLAAGDADDDPSRIRLLGEPSLFTCPDCHGTLVELNAAGPVQFRCHTGHAFTATSLIGALSDNVENTLWSALRGLEEQVMLLRHLADHSRDRQEPAEAAKLALAASRMKKRSLLVRQALLGDVERPTAD